MIGVFAGNINDTQYLLDRTKVIGTSDFGQSTIKTCMINNEKVIIAGTGYGKVNIGTCLGYLLGKCPIRSIICVGNCGALESNNVNLNNIAISTRSTQFDVDFSAIGYPEPLIPGLNMANYNSNSTLTKLAEISSQMRNLNYSEGLFASGDKFVASDTLSGSINQRFNAQFVDNETGCLGELAYINNIPFISVKGISNYADNNASQNYYANKDESNRVACQVVNTMLCLMAKKCTTCQV